MLSFLRSLKFSWDVFFGTGVPVELAWREGPLVGRYCRTPEVTWWTTTILKGLGYKVSISAWGSGPTIDQMAVLEALAVKIPSIVAAADLDPIPNDDGNGHAAPSFDKRPARVRSILEKNDGTIISDFRG